MQSSLSNSRKKKQNTFFSKKVVVLFIASFASAFILVFLGATLLKMDNRSRNTVAEEPTETMRPESVSWNFDEETGTLYVTGEGAMGNYSLAERPPWEKFKTEIATVVIGEGITRIGNASFSSCFNLKKVVLPNSLTCIGPGAFDSCSELVEIIIPKTVTEIGYGAFYLCRSLAYIELPLGIKAIGGSTFAACDSLRTVTIPEGVELIGELAFDGCPLEEVFIPKTVTELATGGATDSMSICANSFRCSTLKAIIVDEDNPVYKSVDGVLFDKSGKNLLQYPSGREGAYMIPAGIQEIGDYAFYESDATDVVFPDSLLRIGAGAFEYAFSLNRVYLPDGLIEIGFSAFNSCKGLSNISIPTSVQAIGAGAFLNCPALEAQSGLIQYRGTKNQWVKVKLESQDRVLSKMSFVSAESVANVGETLVFGRYEQDGNLDNGKEDLEWIVLTISDKYALLITKYAIDTKPYHENLQNITWEGCSLRKWLNEEFVSSAFNEDEQSANGNSLIKNDTQINIDWPTSGGKDTTDKVFLLSYREARQYFANSDARRCVPTQYALSTGTWLSEEGRCHWWLRSPGETQENAAYCSYEGNLYSGTWCNNNAIAVRPVIWVDLTKVEVKT